MALRPTLVPSPWGVPIPNLQARYPPFVPQAPVVVDEREAGFRREIDALMFKCQSLDSELSNVNRCRQAESATVKLLLQSNMALQEKARKSGEELNRTIVDLKKEIEGLKSTKIQGPSNPAPIELKPVKTEEVSTDRVSELEQMNKALEQEKRALEVEIRKLEAAKEANEARKVKQKTLGRLSAKILELENDKEIQVEMMKSLEREKEASEAAVMEIEKKMSELVGRNDLLEREKEASEAAVMKIEKKMSELIGRNDVLEGEKEALEAAVVKIDSEKSKEIERILNEKTTLEVEKKFVEDEGMKIIEALEREKNEMEAKVCQAKQENNEEIQRILNETKAANEGYEKQISELADRNVSLEKDKSRLEGKKKELKIGINFLASMLVQNIQITRQLCLSNNAVPSTATQLIEGRKSDGMTLPSACKRKRTSIQKPKEPAVKKSKGSA